MVNKVKNETVDAVEIVESEDLKNTLINLDKYRDCIKAIDNAISSVADNFVRIGRELFLVKRDKLYVIDGYKDVYEFAKVKFGFGVTSTKNFINVYTRFANDDGSYYINVKEEYRNYSLSQLIELLPVSEEDIKKYKPSQTVEQIREIKKMSQLSDQNDKYIKEFNKMSERVKSLFIEKLKLNSISSEITFDIEEMEFQDYFSFEYDGKNYDYSFTLKLDYDHDLEYDVSRRGYHRGSIYVNECNFLELIDKLKGEFTNFVEERKKEKEEEQLLVLEKEKEKEKLKNCKLKSDKARYEFVDDINNWNLLSDLPGVNMQIYQFSAVDKFLLLKFGKNIWYFATEIKYNKYWTVGKYVIVDALRDMKY